MLQVEKKRSCGECGIIVTGKRFYVAENKCPACYARIDRIRDKSNGRKRTEKYRHSLLGGRRETDISLQLYTKLLSRPCHYCRGPLNRTGTGLDRVDSNIGYMVSNVVPCCAACNQIKGANLSCTEMVAVAQLLLTMRQDECNVRHAEIIKCFE